MNDKFSFDDIGKMLQAAKLAGSSTDRTESYSIGPDGKKNPLHTYNKNLSPVESGSGKQGESIYTETGDGRLILFQDLQKLVRAKGCCPEEWVIDDGSLAKCFKCGKILCRDHKNDFVYNMESYCRDCFTRCKLKKKGLIQLLSLEYIEISDRKSKKDDALTKALVVTSRKEIGNESVTGNSRPRKQIRDNR